MPDIAIPNDPARAIAEGAAASAPRLVAIRRDLHAHPELAFAEQRTAGVVAAELSRLGIPHRTGVGRTGVVGLIEGGLPGPTLALRADMDALPIAEQTGLAFASRAPGLMHACGHDVHTATLLGAAAILRDLAPALAGRVKLVFQPAEETLAGAAAMIADGVMENPRVDMALGFHNYPEIPLGGFATTPGAALAASDRFEITVRGVSGHAAHPDVAVDPILAAATLVVQLQSVVAREIDPFRPAVLTVGAIQGGVAHNIIPDEVVLRGTARSLDEETRTRIEAALRRLCEGVGAGMRAPCTLVYHRGCPPLVNDEGMRRRLVASVAAQFATPVEERAPSLGGEDFAYFAERVPAAHLAIGSGQKGRADRLHNSAYQPDEGAIPLGAAALARAAFDLLRPGAG